jgi:hypothetical protein
MRTAMDFNVNVRERILRPVNEVFAAVIAGYSVYYFKVVG